MNVSVKKLLLCSVRYDQHCSNAVVRPNTCAMPCLGWHKIWTVALDSDGRNRSKLLQL